MQRFLFFVVQTSKESFINLLSCLSNSAAIPLALLLSVSRRDVVGRVDQPVALVIIVPSSSRSSDRRKTCEKPPILLVITIIVLTNSIHESFALIKNEASVASLTHRRYNRYICDKRYKCDNCDKYQITFVIIMKSVPSHLLYRYVPDLS